MTIELQPGETSLGSWTVNQEIAGRRPINGVLNVTNQRLIFDAKMEVSSRQGRQIQQALKGSWKAGNSLAVERSQVTGVEAKNSFFAKRVVVTAASGESYVFNRGMMSVEPIVAALQRS